MPEGPVSRREGLSVAPRFLAWKAGRKLVSFTSQGTHGEEQSDEQNGGRVKFEMLEYEQ